MISDERLLRTQQYVTDARLSSRIHLHERFSTNEESLYRWLSRKLSVGEGPVLDVGCGNGAFWQSNAEDLPAALRATLCDFSRGMLASAERKLARAESAFRFVQGNAAALPFPDHSFETIIANHMLYHVDVDRTLPELRRILEPSGTLYATTNGPDHLCELDALAREVGLVSFGAHAERFSLATGPPRLQSLFENVDVHRYPNHLEVTEPGAVVDYLASADEPTPAQIRTLLELVGRRIEESGHLHVTIDTGLVTAWKARDRVDR